MAPAFSSIKQAAAFALLLLVLLLQPVIVRGPLLPKRGEMFAAASWLPGPFPYVHDQIFEEKGDIDIAFMGSSLSWWGIDTPYVQEQMSRILGRPAVVRSICVSWAGFDSVYFVARELLRHRKVKMIVFSDSLIPDSTDFAHRSTAKWFLWAEDAPVIADLSPREKASFYAAAVVGMPRNLLNHLRSNLPVIPSDHITFFPGLPPAINPALRLGSLAVDEQPTSQTWYADSASRWSQLGKAVADQPPASGSRQEMPGSQPRVYEYSEQTKDNFHIVGAPMPPMQAAFCRKIGSLAGDYGVKLAYLHMTGVIEWKSHKIRLSEFWPDVFGTKVTMIGVPGAELLAGISETTLTNKIYYDSVHFTKDGQKLFATVVTPKLAQVYETQTKP